MNKEYYYDLIENNHIQLIKQTLLEEADNNQFIYAFEKAFSLNNIEILNIIIQTTLSKNELSVANYQLSFLIKENSSDIQDYLVFHHSKTPFISWENLFREVFKYDSHHSFCAIQPYIPHDNNYSKTLFSSACANNSINILKHIPLSQVSEEDFILGLISAKLRGHNESVQHIITTIIEAPACIKDKQKIYTHINSDPELKSIENNMRLHKDLNSELPSKDKLARHKI